MEQKLLHEQITLNGRNMFENHMVPFPNEGLLHIGCQALSCK